MEASDISPLSRITWWVERGNDQKPAHISSWRSLTTHEWGKDWSFFSYCVSRLCSNDVSLSMWWWVAHLLEGEAIKFRELIDFVTAWLGNIVQQRCYIQLWWVLKSNLEVIQICLLPTLIAPTETWPTAGESKWDYFREYPGKEKYMICPNFRKTL